MQKSNHTTTQRGNALNAPAPTSSSKEAAQQEINMLFSEWNEAITWSQRRAIYGQIQAIAEAHNITF